MSEETGIAVIGGGIVGLASAFRLARLGHDVTVIDRGEPLAQASYGNAGHIATEQVFPLASPNTVLSVPAMLAKPNNPLSVRSEYAAQIMPWLVRFAWASRPAAYRRGIAALSSLQRLALQSMATLCDDAGLSALLHQRGHLIIVESDDGVAAAREQQQRYEQHEIASTWQTPAQIAELAPRLTRQVAGLVSIADGESHDGASFPLGTLRLPQLRKKSGFGRNVRKSLGAAGWAQAHSGPLYMVGGTWRALARYAMHAADYPLTDPHGYELDIETAAQLCSKLVRAKPEKLQAMSGISPMRAGYLPDAAALLRVMLDELGPDHLVFSSWGLREGLLFDKLDPLQRAKDPLLAGVEAFAAARNAQITNAALLAGWTVDLANGTGHDNERLRLAGALLAIALQRVEPNMRVNHATEWALDKRWIACDARGRAMICAALFGSLGRTELPKAFRRLASDDDLREAVAWGLGYRLARRLGGASRISMSASALSRKETKLVLRLDESRKALAHYPLTHDLEVLASWLDLEPKIKIGTFDFEEDFSAPSLI